MSITVVLRKLGQASPRQLEYGMQIQAPLNSPRLAYWRLRVCSLHHLFSLQSFDWSSLWHHRAWLRLDMLNPEWFDSLYDVTVAFDFKKEDTKYCLKTLFWLNPILTKAVRDPFIKPWRPTFGSRPMVSETLS